MRIHEPIEIIEKLSHAGFEAYFVGGCVRDLLLNRGCHDWDITTSARPEQTLALFPDSLPTGLEHGTITVPCNHMHVEVTTFRSDGEYLDGRHPTQVCFVDSLSEDLARRDFTVNALAMGENGTIVDLFGGLQDLENRVLRCIGDPVKRFREDSLRMLRAIRFSAQLDFSIEQETRCAIEACAPLCEVLSVERIRDELEKIILSSHPEYLKEMAEMGLLDKLHPRISGDMTWMKTLPKERAVRWAAVYMHWQEFDYTRLRIDKKTGSLARDASRLKKPLNRLGWKHLIAKKGRMTVSVFADLVGCKSIFEEIVHSGECLSLAELAVGGADFPHVKGKELGNLLAAILQEVLENPELNNREKILKKYKISIDY